MLWGTRVGVVWSWVYPPIRKFPGPGTQIELKLVASLILSDPFGHKRDAKNCETLLYYMKE